MSSEANETQFDFAAWSAQAAEYDPDGTGVSLEDMRRLGQRSEVLNIHPGTTLFKHLDQRVRYQGREQDMSVLIVRHANAVGIAVPPDTLPLPVPSTETVDASGATQGQGRACETHHRPYHFGDEMLDTVNAATVARYETSLDWAALEALYASGQGALASFLAVDTSMRFSVADAVLSDPSTLANQREAFRSSTIRLADDHSFSPASVGVDPTVRASELEAADLVFLSDRSDIPSCTHRFGIVTEYTHQGKPIAIDVGWVAPEVWSDFGIDLPPFGPTPTGDNAVVSATAERSAILFGQDGTYLPGAQQTVTHN